MANELYKFVSDKKVSIIFFFCILVFLGLLFKSPFSQRNLISNLEPYPDVLYYVGSAHDFVKGEGLALSREGRTIPSPVPPLYSLSLIPLMALHNDVRMFYFTNVLFALVSAWLFYLILIKLSKNPWVSGFGLFIYVTDYFIYWYPTLAMAENLSLLLFIASVYFLTEKINTRNVILTTLIGVSFYATKYASVPLAGSLFVLYTAKIIFENKLSRFKNLAIYIGSLILLATILLIYESLSRNINVLTDSIHLFSSFLPTSPSTSISKIHIVNNSEWFSPTYFSSNLNTYLKSLIGEPIRFLWDTDPLVTKFVSILGLIGLVVGLFVKRFRFISISLILMLFSAILLMSTFYSVDGRYIYHAIPTLLIGFAIMIELICELFKSKKLSKFFYPLLVVLFLFYLGTSFIRIKNQILLNFRHSETPWYYISVLQLNDYFTQPVGGKKPIVISSMPPYYIDFFSNGNYDLLPLSLEQEFPGVREQAWGSNDYSDLPRLYAKYLNEGYKLYVDEYGLGNVAILHRDFDSLQKDFTLTLVKGGCYEECNIYKVSLKSS